MKACGRLKYDVKQAANMDNWEEINRRLENAMLVTSRIQERHAAGLKDHREWLEDLTRVATEHQQRMADHACSMADHDRRMEDHDRRVAEHERWLERHELTMRAIDERLEQISIKVDRIAELIFRDRSSNGHDS
jgi:hypothetical protein